MFRKLGFGIVLLGSLVTTLTASACPWGTKSFACCQTSSIVGAPETRLLGGCEISKATAWTRCVATGFARSDLRLNWDGDSCRTGGGSSNNSEPTYHACSIAQRGSSSFTFFAYGSKSSYTKSQICNKAREFNNTRRDSTHYWYTTYWPNKMHKAIADCQNGSWVAYGKGIDAINKVNAIRKDKGGKGCLFKIDKSWNPTF